jgi:hypothetical protein
VVFIPDVFVLFNTVNARSKFQHNSVFHCLAFNMLAIRSLDAVKEDVSRELTFCRAVILDCVKICGFEMGKEVKMK